MNSIYLDNAATTMLDSKVIKTINEANKIYGNPSSIHSFGQEARKIIDQARDALANFLGCTAMEIIFTSGGSESDNLAIRGIVESYQSPHVITTAIEHHAVLHTIQGLENEGKIETTYIKPGKDGVVTVLDIEKSIKPNTKLISVMYVNNEIGTIQPIREIGKMIERKNKDRSASEKIYFHTDAVQGAEFLNMDVKYLHVDLLTLTAHKLHGPKGVGALFVKKGTPIRSHITGGDQEFKKRAGTENTTAIAGLSAAIIEVKNQKSKTKSLELLRDRLENFILKNIPATYLNGDKANRAPHILNISFKNAEGEAIILNLDFLGIAVSSGSACTAHSLEPSHVLTAIQIPRVLSHGAIRFSLSRYTTREEIDKVCEVLPGIIKKLREMSPFN
jgi:cysteine desulfurase